MTSTGKHAATLAVFSFALFLSAASMFALQPMAGKMLLPIVGGTPAGWVVAMAFFQVMLLAGYLIAHLFSRLTPHQHTLLYVVLLGLGALFLPVDIAGRAGMIHGTPGPFGTFSLLTAALSLPFIALSATSSTLQRLFMTTGHPSSKDPYFLYAASNLGSFGGLFAYPIVIEPYLSLTAQAQGWYYAYTGIIGCALLCLALSGKAGRKEKAKEKKKAAIKAPWPGRIEWMLLAFFPSSLLMGVTSLITTDIFSVPMIWVLPLGLYLLTFVVAFSKKPIVSLKTMESLFPYIGVATILTVLLQQQRLDFSFWCLLPLLVLYTGAVLYCHLRLAALRPAGDDDRLTEFYLLLSVGGALGGVINAFIIPVVLERAIEFPLVLLACLALHPSVGFKSRGGTLILAIVAIAFLVSGIRLPHIPAGSPALVECALILVAAGLILAPPRRMIPGLAVLFLLVEFALTNTGYLLTHRNFFGVIKVYDTQRPLAADKNILTRNMVHGTTLHGFQMLEGPYRTVATSYYTNRGPLGDVFDAWKPQKVAVIGLGTGTIACHIAPGRRFTFIDIDPDVADVAQKQFSFLSDCSPEEPPRILLGDGRLELAKLAGEKFDLLIVDAFSSDVIPTHMLTEEALKLYADRIADGGVLALHISNRFFNLQPTIAATADRLGLLSLYIRRTKGLELYGFGSVWVAVSRPGANLDRLEKYGWEPMPRHEGVRPWTDDYTNLLSTLRYLQ